MKPGYVVGAQAREEHNEVRRHEDIDVVELQQTQAIDYPPEVPRRYRAVRALFVEALGRERNAPCVR